MSKIPQFSFLLVYVFVVSVLTFVQTKNSYSDEMDRIRNADFDIANITLNEDFTTPACAAERRSNHPTPYEGVKGFWQLLNQKQNYDIACRFRIKKSIFLKERDFVAPYNICLKSDQSQIKLKSIDEIIDVRTRQDVSRSRCELINSIYQVNSCKMPEHKAT